MPGSASRMASALSCWPTTWWLLTSRPITCPPQKLNGSAARALITGEPEPTCETVDGVLVRDDQHIYQFVHRDKQRSEVAIYERTG